MKLNPLKNKEAIVILAAIALTLLTATSITQATEASVNKEEQHFTTVDPELAETMTQHLENCQILNLQLVGNGILYAHEDEERTIEAPTQHFEDYVVIYNTEYYFNITGITEYYNTEIHVWANYLMDHTIQNVLIDNFTIEDTPSTITFNWTTPSEDQIDSPIIFRYGKNSKISPRNWYFAGKPVGCRPLKLMRFPRLLFVIPEIPLGSLGVTTAIFSALGITAYTRNKKSKTHH